MATLVGLTGGTVRIEPANTATRQARLLAASLPAPSGGILGDIVGVVKRIGGEVIRGVIPGIVPSQPRPPTTPFAQPTNCPEGFVFRNGRCEVAGIRGTIERTLPGGSTGFLPMTVETPQATIGAFGLPAALPAQVGTIRRSDGTQGPILRCSPGMVLGKDDLCYPKQVLGRRGRFRKYPAPQRPPITAADAAAIRKAASARNRVKKLAGDVGFKCSVRGRR